MIENILSEVKQVVLSCDDKAKVILYGSRARGDFREESDWDILVLTSYLLDSAKKGALQDEIYDLELKHGQAVSTLILDKFTWDYWEVMPLHKNVTKEGVPL